VFWVGRRLSNESREQKEKQEAKANYSKLHAQGKTHEAKADLAEEEEEGKTELTRAQRKELKKKEKEIHVAKKVTIADLDSPRELTWRER
jgi:hypothetical protein